MKQKSKQLNLPYEDPQIKKKSPLFRISQRKETVLNKNRKQKQIRSKSFSTKTKLKIKKQKLKNPSNSIIHETQNRKKKNNMVLFYSAASLSCVCVYIVVYIYVLVPWKIWNTTFWKRRHRLKTRNSRGRVKKVADCLWTELSQKPGLSLNCDNLQVREREGKRRESYCKERKKLRRRRRRGEREREYVDLTVTLGSLCLKIF